MAPAVVIRPILLLGYVFSVNHSAPSGPAVMKFGLPLALGIGYSVMAPVVAIRPMLLPICSTNHSAPSEPTAIPAG